MKEFFSGARRKVGCLTLLMACVFMVGWLNSSRVLHMMLPTGKTGFQVISRNGTLTIRNLGSDYPLKAITNNADRILLIIDPAANPPRMRAVPLGEDHYLAIGDPYKWTVQLWGLRFGNIEVQIGEVEERLSSLRISVCTIPYWLVVVPLTVLSAFLLLKKPKTSTQKKALEPLQTRERRHHEGGQTNSSADLSTDGAWRDP